MREIRTSGLMSGRVETEYGMRLLRHQGETLIQNYAEVCPTAPPPDSTFQGGADRAPRTSVGGRNRVREADRVEPSALSTDAPNVVDSLTPDSP